MRFVDFDPINRTSVGFDRLISMLENTLYIEHADNDIRCTIEKFGPDSVWPRGQG